MAYDQAPESVDPYFNNVRIGVIIAANVWDTLLYRDPVTHEYKGQLARSWKQVNDKTLEFELRQGVKFHNGEEFDADSVVYTLNYVADPANKAVTQQNVQWIDKVEKVGKYTVRIISKAPFPAAKDYLATTLAIHPAKYYKEVGPKGMNAKPVGSGPYKVIDYQPGKSITLEKFADYFKDSPRSQPKIGKIRIRFIPDRQTQMAEVMSGGEDFIMHVPKDQADKLQAVPNLQVMSGNTMRIVFMLMNTLDGAPNPELKDPRVRKAIAHAIDREAIVKNIVGAGAEIINSHVHAVAGGLHPGRLGGLQVRSGAGQEAAGRGGLSQRLQHRDRCLPGAQPDRSHHQLPAGRGHQGQAELPAVRRHARHDPRQQGRPGAPDLGLQPR